MRCECIVTLSSALLLCTALVQAAAECSAAECSAVDQTNSWSTSDTGNEPRDDVASCSMPVLDVNAGSGTFTHETLVQRLTVATTPLLIRGLLDLFPSWRAQAQALGNRTAMLANFGGEEVKLSVPTLLSNGPESTKLDGKKLSFMQEAWAAVNGSALGDTIERQVRAGELHPRVSLDKWFAALRDGSAPRDAYVFHNISRGAIAQALGPLHTLWRDVAVAEHAQQPPVLMRLGVGGAGSGAPFHDHSVHALNVAFRGRKRWLITQPCQPSCRIPFYTGGAAVWHPQRLYDEVGNISTVLLLNTSH